MYGTIRLVEREDGEADLQVCGDSDFSGGQFSSTSGGIWVGYFTLARSSSKRTGRMVA